MKKLISLFLTLVMVFSLAVPALAAEDTITLYFDNTEGWSEVYAFIDSDDLWPGTAMTLVEGETSIYSIEVPTDAAYVRFIEGVGGFSTVELTLPTDGTNLFTITGWSAGLLQGEWSVYVSNRKGDVTANFNPDIEIKGISFTGDTVTYDSDTNTYTFVIPVGEEAVEGVGVTKGTNLNYIPADDETYLVKVYSYEGGELLAETELPFGMFVNDESGYYIYDEATGTLTQQCEASTDAAGYTLGVSFSNDGGLSWSDLVYYVVKQAYAIKVDNSIANGSVYVGADNSKTSAVEGETVELFVHAAEGYELESLTVTDGEGNGVTVNEDHAFVMPASAVTVNATFKEAATAYTITVDNTNVGGTVTVNDNLTSAHAGDNITLTVTLDESWELVAVTVNDGTVEVHQVQGESDQYTFTMPAADVTVTATFKAVHGISIDWVGEGSVTANPPTAAKGETVTLTITPVAGYALYYLHNDSGLELEVTGNTCTFTMPEGPVGVHAVFERSGKALETLYVKNTGSWKTINVYFYTDSGTYNLAAENLTIVGGETEIYYTTAIPEFAYKVKFQYDEEYSEIIDLPTDGKLNQYNPDDGTWTEFVATEQAPISANIAWGSMAFTYDDSIDEETGTEKGWTNDATDGGTVTVTNTGDTDFTAAVSYTALESYDEITGSFDAEPATLVTDASQIFTLTLEGKPEKAIPEGTKIGTVTVTIK